MKKATIWRMCGKVSEPCLLVLGKWLSSLLTHSGVGVTRLPALEICQSPPSHSSAQSGPANQGHDREHSTSQMPAGALGETAVLSDFLFSKWGN